MMLDRATLPDEAPWCCPQPPVKNLTGPDEPGIQCWPPEGCCMPSPCAVQEWDFLCVVRSLLPEGDIFNNTRQHTYTPPRDVGVANVGCARVGCEQLILGGCCDDMILCDDDPPAPQLAVVDSFAAVAYGVIKALCALLRELDPCTAQKLIRYWAERMGIEHSDPCGPGFSDRILAMLICVILQIRHYRGAHNWEFLTTLAHRFGAEIVMRYAGDLNCGPSGWWTMARDHQDCPPVFICPPDATAPYIPIVRPVAECSSPPLSLNIVICPGDVIIAENCNLSVQEQRLPHDPELYEAFRYWLLPKLLEGARGVFWCVYDCDPADCIV